MYEIALTIKKLNSLVLIYICVQSALTLASRYNNKIST